ncbi:aldehyde dehydrogenase family protein [Diplonema papillatum]|nr:aldehyde dehydrogenase family protein [Diplonema papillatum]
MATQDPERAVDDMVKEVAAKADEWAALSDKEKLQLLYEIRTATEAVLDEWSAAADAVRGNDKHDHLRLSGYTTAGMLFGATLTSTIATYESLANTGKPPKPLRSRKVGDQEVLAVYPMTWMESFLLPISAEVWLEPGTTATQGKCREQKGLIGILGAGNFEAPIDILHSMFIESRVAVYARHANLTKSNVFTAQIYKCLVDKKYLGILEPGIPLASALTKHAQVDCLMMTGGCATYDKIVWGDDKAKKSGEKKVTKPFSAELGAVSPYVVVPSAKYTAKELDAQAGALVGFKLANSSAVCASPQLLIVGKNWEHREEFMKKVAEKFQAAAVMPVFYPGTEDRAKAAEDAYKAEGKEVLKFEKPHGIQPIVIRNLTEADVPSYSTRNEAFAPVLVELAIDADDSMQFFEKVVKLVNSDDVFGSLSCTLIVHPSTEKDLGREYFDYVLQRLEWGSIGVNNWACMSNFISTGLWGAFPKHNPRDIQSGTGFVLNTLMLDHPQKVTLRTPWGAPGLPTGGARQADQFKNADVSRQLLNPSWWRLTRAIVSAVRSML